PAVSFTATMVGAQGTVTWTLSGPGSVTPESGISTSYTPPASVDASQTATLTAALADPALSAEVTITINPVGTDVDTTPPAVSLSSSSSEVTAPGAITLSASASDDVGVTKVVFFEGATRLGEDDSAPYTFERRFGAADNGSYSYTATAFDAAGNSGSSDPVTVIVDIPATEVLFTEENAWRGDIPADAEVVSPDEFRQGVESGELALSSTASEEAQRAALEQQFNDNKALLMNIPDPSPDVQALLAEAGALSGFEGDRPVTTPGGDTVLFGLGTQLRNAVESYELSQSVDNALTDYTQTYALLPDELKADAATPESLAGKSLADVREALSTLDALLADVSELDNTRLEGDVPLPPELSAQAIRPGGGRDNNGPCANPTGLAGRYWFPLKRFISPMKDQANRGTCWAFTAVGAIESRERVQNNNPADLSEQFLVNKVKQDWDSSDYTDGYWSERALNKAVDKGQLFPSEAGWTYNPATNRPRVRDGDSDSYARACDPYGLGPNAGTCSDTAHQSRRVCTTFVFKFCSYERVTYSGPGATASRAYQVWSNGQSFDLNRYRLLLSQGYLLMASFPVYRGVMDDAANGVVSNYAKTYFDDKGVEKSGSYGGHAVQIVGFLSNDQLTTPGAPANVGGSGYFIIKNSWGCFAGDGGYYYVPADYVSSLFTSLSALSFDTRRSDAWNREQATPGGSEAPKIDITANPARVDLRVSSDLARFFKVSHPVAKSVTLTVSGSGLGTLY
ncbi:MAG: Ig-like domain-containing protein, partial [Deinococcota bacterium]|nr:Ig-like domain-containing protein [Deinococcota bacterium]